MSMVTDSSRYVKTIESYSDSRASASDAPLSDAAAVAPTFTAPAKAAADQTLVFELVASDGVIQIKQLQPAGKKGMTGTAFVNGYQPPTEARFDA